MKRTPLVLLALALVVSLALSLAACGGSSAPGGGGSAASATVSIMTDYLPNGKYAPLVVAQKEQLYSKQALNVTIIPGKGSTLTAQAVANGQVNFGIVYDAVYALAVAKGEPIVSVGQYDAGSTFGFFVPKDSNITSIADLAGHKVIIAPGTPQALVLDGVFSLAGISPSSVQRLSLAPAVADSAYVSGTGDALAEELTYAPLIQPKRPSRALPWAAVGFQLPDYSIVVNQSYLQAHKDVVARFLKATYQGITDALADPSRAVAGYAADNPTLQTDVIAGEFNNMSPYWCSTAMQKAGEVYGYHNGAAWTAGVSLLQKVAGLSSSISAGNLYTNIFFESPYLVSTVKCQA